MDYLDKEFESAKESASNEREEEKKGVHLPLYRRFKNERHFWLVLFLLLIAVSGFSAYLAFGAAIGDFFVKKSDEQVQAPPVSDFEHFKVDKDKRYEEFSLKAEASDEAGIDLETAFVLSSEKVASKETVEKSLRFEPAREFTVEEISPKEWKIKPATALYADSLVKLVLAAEASAVEDNASGTPADTKAQTEAVESEEEAKSSEELELSWVFQVKDGFKVMNTLPRQASANVPLDTGIEITFSHDTYADLDPYFSIDPPLAGRFERHGRTAVFVPTAKLSVLQVYTIKISKELPLKGSDLRLADDFSFSFETSDKDRQNSAWWNIVCEEVAELNSREQAVFRLCGNIENGKKVKAEVFRYPNDTAYFRALKDYDKLPWWSNSKRRQAVDVSQLNMVGSFELEQKLSSNGINLEFPKPLEKGFYLIKFATSEASRVWLQVSDTSVYYNITETDTIVWAHDIISGQPVSGVMAEIVGSNAKGETGDDGIAVFKTPNELYEKARDSREYERYYLRIANGEDVLYQPAMSIYGEIPSVADSFDYWSYLYSDRPRYQPSDTIKVWGMAQRRDSAPIEGGLHVRLTRHVYDGGFGEGRPMTLEDKVLNPDEQGAVNTEFQIDNLTPGYYNLDLMMGDTFIRSSYIAVQPYIKPAYQLSLTPDRTEVYADDTIKLKVKATFFEGTPVPDLPLVFAMPEGDFKFQTDKNGEYELSYSLKYSHDKSGSWPRYSFLSVHPENPELASISADTNVNFYGPDVVVTSDSSYPEKGVGQISFQSNKIQDNEGKFLLYSNNEDRPIASNIRVKGTITKIIWDKKETGTAYDYINKRSYKTYSYTERREAAGAFELLTDDKGQGSHRLNLSPDTSYEVAYSYYDNKGRTDKSSAYLYYYDGRELHNYADGGYRYHHLEYSKDSSLGIGEMGKVSFKENQSLLAPAPKRFLYMQLHRGLQEYKINDGPEYELSFEERDIPNVSVAAAYFNGSSYIQVGAGYWGEGFTYDHKEKNLDIEIKTDKEIYGPGEEATISVSVKDKDGQAKAASVNINLVDEAYYAVANDLASPRDSLYAGVPDGSWFANSSHVNFADGMYGAEKGGCFLAGTLITLADGQEKKIERIAKGDKVLTFVDPISKEKDSGQVTELWHHTVNSYLIINNSLRVTREHQIYSGGRFTDAGLLKPGDQMLDESGQEVIIKTIVPRFETVTVFNFRVDPQHTYFADGIYVHNQEKGGGPRSFFTDAALFASLVTDASGKASTKLKLPDNVSTWRISAQAISRDLYAGVATKGLPVTLPMFVDVGVSDEYLIGDKPVVKLRAYGTALSGGEETSFSLLASSLGITEPKGAVGEPFSPVFVPLPELRAGRHEITYSAKTKKNEDSLRLPLSVSESYLRKREARSYALKQGLKLSPINERIHEISFVDQGAAELYPTLVNLAWTGGDRVDQSLVAEGARKDLLKYFQEEDYGAGFEAYRYQLNTGGIALLPYGSEDLELSLAVALASPQIFDKIALAQYFRTNLENRKSNREQVSMALSGLAALGEPELVRLSAWLKREDLSLMEKIYLANGLQRLGDGARATAMYEKIMEETAERNEPYILIRTKGGQDETFRMTFWMAILGARLERTEAEGLWAYALANHQPYSYMKKNSDQLYLLERLAYIESVLPGLHPDTARLKYRLAGEEKELVVAPDERPSLILKSEDLAKLEFLEVEGNIGVTIEADAAMDQDKTRQDKEIGIERRYFVKGKETDTFASNDTVQVRLYPKFGALALAGDYEISDYLPAGLAPVTNLYYWGSGGDCNRYYPYDIEKHRVKFRINRDWSNWWCGEKGMFYYDARVSAPGEYISESAVIQSLSSVDKINFSARKKIIIKQ